MNRILILGMSGAGKSTLNAKLGKMLGLPVVHLDRHYWQPGWRESEPQAFRETIRTLAAQEQWIMDGNFIQTMELRMPRADMIIYFDFPRPLCYWRVIKRWLTYRKSERPDMGPGCPEKMDWEFILWIWKFKKDIEPKIMSIVKKYNKEDALVMLRTQKEMDRFVAEF